MYNNVKNIITNDVTPDMIGKPYLLAETSLRTTDWGEDFQFLSENLSKNPDIDINEIAPDIYWVKNVLTSSQCEEIITKAAPSNVLNEGISPQIKYPNAIAKTKAKYFKGLTRDTSANL